MARTLYLTEQGATLSRRGERLVVEREGETLADLPAAKVLRVFVFGNVSLTTPAIAYLLREGKEVAFLSSRGRYYGWLISAESKNPVLRRTQFRVSEDPSISLDLARRFVLGKLANQRRLLHRRPGRQASLAAKEITALIQRARFVDSLDFLRGVEGLAARAYFGAFGELLEKMTFTGRRRRPPPQSPTPRPQRLRHPVQRSVFEFDLAPKEVERMMVRVARLIDEGEDTVRLYRLCAACLTDVRILGEGTLSLDPDYYII